MPLAALPPYSIRQSSRARRVSLKVHLNGRVEVVVPLGFNQEQLPALLQSRREWLWQMVGQIQATMAEDHCEARPGQIQLRSRQQTWLVLYQEAKLEQIKLSQIQPLTLALRGNIHSPGDCRDLLRQWLGRKARAELAPWLRQLSFELNLPFRRISIRGQKTRWASCSSQKDISLNYKLLFLPTDLVHYVFVHELCHTIHMNHSPGFWQLVAEKYPAYGPVRAQLREGWRYIPGWIEG
ncbi:MAG: M48 family metallopeptidase [Cyanobacteria bacterium REEB459]|nr:M48 family metallopeptidase [Cyanobacteria bacterium REEB459]